MAGIIRTAVRVGVIGALAVGGTILVASATPRGRALLSQARQNFDQAIDRHIDDPIALRTKLHDLVRRNPERIAEVRADLAEVDQQIAEFQREMAISQRVVELAQADLETLQALLARADRTRAEHASFDGQAPEIRIRFDGRPMTVQEAYARAVRIDNQRQAYARRATEIASSLEFLGRQRAQLESLLARLEEEHGQLQAELWLLDRDVDAIARNQRLLRVMERRQETIDRNSRYLGTSLDGYKRQVARIKAEQERRLDLLSRGAVEEDYVNRAQLEVDRNRREPLPYTPGAAEPGTLMVEPEVLEATPPRARPATEPIATRG